MGELFITIGAVEFDFSTDENGELKMSSHPELRSEKSPKRDAALREREAEDARAQAADEDGLNEDRYWQQQADWQERDRYPEPYENDQLDAGENDAWGDYDDGDFDGDD